MNDKSLDSKENKQYETAIFAGGCFWCMVEPFDTQPGIISVVSGYTGGDVPNPTYEQVCTGTTGHTEAVKITFDPKIISYADLVKIYWQVTDPTDAMGQFQDRGSQYQPVIYYNSPEQKEIAIKSKEDLEKSGKFDEPIVVRIEPAKPFYPAEEYHQDFYKKDPLRYQLEEMGGREQYKKKYWNN
ncbi:peptide-methionine (S)-S-oxide reductase MsrA [Lactobacillus sp. PV034]|uniref:peptide-methionine (S)-S-oxide reductase MsrA n=1 Tax=Lactobacillus sp. PV034 TaxID=2594495 RepID=UPI00223EE161|nr:peptide-methionine (S)-S-oxide reductase MsrA [Lactobacillus sp. PV034]QNQ80379.1 peptide-methionine (S)-S-oxide reductase MsrA [Lactobacillus sp. PV034]